MDRVGAGPPVVLIGGIARQRLWSGLAASGTVVLGGRSLVGASPYARSRRGVARTFQSLELFEDMTVLDNIRADADRHRWWPLLTDLVRPSRRTLSEPAVTAIRESG